MQNYVEIYTRAVGLSLANENTEKSLASSIVAYQIIGLLATVGEWLTTALVAPIQKHRTKAALQALEYDILVDIGVDPNAIDAHVKALFEAKRTRRDKRADTLLAA